jgi:hypothetical protein
VESIGVDIDIAVVVAEPVSWVIAASSLEPPHPVATAAAATRIETRVTMVRRFTSGLLFARVHIPHEAACTRNVSAP